MVDDVTPEGDSRALCPTLELGAPVRAAFDARVDSHEVLVEELSRFPLGYLHRFVCYALHGLNENVGSRPLWFGWQAKSSRGRADTGTGIGICEFWACPGSHIQSGR